MERNNQLTQGKLAYRGKNPGQPNPSDFKVGTDLKIPPEKSLEEDASPRSKVNSFNTWSKIRDLSTARCKGLNPDL